MKASASADVSELATDPVACENQDQASFSDFVQDPTLILEREERGV